VCHTADGCLSIVEDGPPGGPGVVLAYRVDPAGAVGRAEAWAVARLAVPDDSDSEVAGVGSDGTRGWADSDSSALLQRVWTAGRRYADGPGAWARSWFRIGPPGPGPRRPVGPKDSAAAQAQAAQERGAARAVGQGVRLVRGGTRVVRRRRRGATAQKLGGEAVPRDPQAGEEEKNGSDEDLR
jgi:hypothetical protein